MAKSAGEAAVKAHKALVAQLKALRTEQVARLEKAMTAGRRWTWKQFEALFMQMVLKSMRDATMKSDMFDSSAQQMYTGMLDQQLAVKLAERAKELVEVKLVTRDVIEAELAKAR